MTLVEYIDTYKKDFIDHLKNEEIFYKKLSLIDAIKNAASGIATDEKMNEHQYRIGKRKCQEGANELLKYEVEIRKSKSFEELFTITENVRRSIPGLGSLWSYDTALRVGFNRDFYPAEVYLQCGAKDGAKILLKKSKIGERKLPVNAFNINFQNLKPYEIENFLCVGKRIGWLY